MIVEIYEDVDEPIIATVALPDRPYTDEIVRYVVGETTYYKLVKHVVLEDTNPNLIVIVN